MGGVEKVIKENLDEAYKLIFYTIGLVDELRPRGKPTSNKAKYYNLLYYLLRVIEACFVAIRILNYTFEGKK